MQVPVMIHVDVRPGAQPGQLAAVVGLVGGDKTVWETSALTPLVAGQTLTFGPVLLTVTHEAGLAVGKTQAPVLEPSAKK